MDRREFLAAAAVSAASLTIGCVRTLDQPKSFVSDRISVVTVGSGPDVVLIPGLATSRDVWSGTTEAVPGYRYHLVQIAGFAGTSPLANARPGPLLEPVAGEVVRYIVEQRLNRPAIVGHSLGGLLALVAAAARPDAVSKVMVVDMVPYGAMLFKGLDVTPEEGPAIGAMARERYFGADRPAATQRIYATMIRTDELRPKYVAQAMASDGDVAGRLFGEVAATDVRTRLKAITGALTVLYVSNSNAPADLARTDALYRAAYRNLPAASLKRIDDSYHFIMLDQPERFAQELRTFLR